jgi:hypothetical protein
MVHLGKRLEVVLLLLLLGLLKIHDETLQKLCRRRLLLLRTPTLRFLLSLKQLQVLLTM